MTFFTIGKLARAACVGVETVRFYERRGLIDQPPKPLSGGFREYPSKTISQILFIRRAQALGFSLKEIAVLLSLRNNPNTDCAEVQSRARQKLAEVERKVADLMKIGESLSKVINTCPAHGQLGECSIIAAIENPASLPV